MCKGKLHYTALGLYKTLSIRRTEKKETFLLTINYGKYIAIAIVDSKSN